ncbi:MAG: PEGA domain-containing protein [Deltaproteobacteria bacterium]|nr:PEGA domain-containing protein [Deltaproteobacteria bacterium]
MPRFRDLILLLVSLGLVIWGVTLIGGQTERETAAAIEKQRRAKLEEQQRARQQEQQLALQQEQALKIQLENEQRKIEQEKDRQTALLLQQKKQEEEARRQLARHGGVRGVELTPSAEESSSMKTSPMPLELPQGSSGLTLVSLEVRTDPAGAEVFLDWRLKGKTPLRLEGESIGGLLVVVKEGHQAWFRQVSYQTSDALDLDLPPEPLRPPTRLLLMISGEPSSDSFSSLKDSLGNEGFVVLGSEEARDFEEREERAQGLSHEGFRAWARARFDTDLLVRAQVHQSSREIAEQELGFPDIREAAKGTIRTNARIELRVFDLRSGTQVASVSGHGDSFALDRAQSSQKALVQASAAVAKELRQQVERGAVSQGFRIKGEPL